MRYISLCSGIEAASVAWGPLGWAPICFSEVEEFPSEVLRQRFPDVPNVGDVTTYDWSKYRGAADVVVFGSPCTSFSVAGLRKGLDDPKGRVMLSCLEAARSIRPRWVVIENVPALLSSHRGEDFQRLLETMAGFWPGGGYLMAGSPQRVLRLGPAAPASLRCRQHWVYSRCRKGTT